MVAGGRKVEGIGEIGEKGWGPHTFRDRVSHENVMNSRENRVNDTVITLYGAKK